LTLIPGIDLSRSSTEVTGIASISFWVITATLLPLSETEVVIRDEVTEIESSSAVICAKIKGGNRKVSEKMRRNLFM